MINPLHDVVVNLGGVAALHRLRERLRASAASLRSLVPHGCEGGQRDGRSLPAAGPGRQMRVRRSCGRTGMTASASGWTPRVGITAGTQANLDDAGAAIRIPQTQTGILPSGKMPVCSRPRGRRRRRAVSSASRRAWRSGSRLPGRAWCRRWSAPGRRRIR